MTGYYQIDPDGSAAGNPFEIFCDFDTVLNGAVLTTVRLSLMSWYVRTMQTDKFYQEAKRKFDLA